MDDEEEGHLLGVKSGVSPGFVRGKIGKRDFLAVEYVQPVEGTRSLEDLLAHATVDERYIKVVKTLFAKLVLKGLSTEANASNIVVGFLHGQLGAWVVDANLLRKSEGSSRKLANEYLGEIRALGWAEGPMTEGVTNLLESIINPAQISDQFKTPGGIDMTAKRLSLDIERDKGMISQPMDLKALENIEIDGLYIKDIEITPLKDLPQVLGLPAG